MGGRLEDEMGDEGGVGTGLVGVSLVDFIHCTKV